MPKQLNVNLAFTADTDKAKAQLKELQQSLQDIAKLPGKANSLFDDKEIKEALQVSQDMAYKIVNTDGFPSIKIGRTIRVPEDEFDKWVKK